MAVIVRQVLIENIRADASAQPRQHILTDVVAAYADDMARGAEFPPLVVFQEGDAYWLADGFHRLSAARGVAKRIACEVYKGGLREAVLFSCGANAEHGYRRTNEDKRRAVTKLLTDEEWSHWSDVEIARRANVSAYLVGTMRADTSINRSMESDARTFMHPKTGVPTKMKTAAIGGRKAAEPSSQVESSVKDAQPAENVQKLKPTEEMGWVCPMVWEVDRLMQSLPDAAEVALRFPSKQRHTITIERIREIADWWSTLATQWPGQQREVG